MRALPGALFLLVALLLAPAAAAFNITLLSPANLSWTSLGNSSLNFTFNQTSEYDEANCSLFLNEVAVGAANVTNATEKNVTSGAPFVLGANIWQVSCTNSTTTDYSENRTFFFDNISSSATAAFPADGYNTSATALNFTLSGTDNLNLSHLAILANFSGSWGFNSTNSSPFNGTGWNVTVGLPEGRFIWAAFSNDTAGNSNTSANYTLTVDRTGPVVQAAEFANGTNHSAASLHSFSFYSTDALLSPSGCVLVFNGTTNATASSSYSSGWCNLTSVNISNLSDGTSRLYLNSTDTLGNWALNDSFSIVADSIAPTISPPANSTLYFANASFTITFGETVNSTWLVNGSGDNVTVQNSTGSLAVNTNLSEGTYAWTVYARDWAGNYNSSTFNFTVNLTRPYVNLTAPANATRTNETNYTFSFNVTHEGNSSMNCSLLVDGSLASYNESVLNSTVTSLNATNLSYGTHTWAVRCSDAENTTYSESRTLYVSYLDITHLSFPAVLALGERISLNASVRAYGNNTNDTWLSISVPAGWMLAANSTDAQNFTNTSTVFNASNLTLPFGALFWNNVTLVVGGAVGPATITLTANSSQNISTTETISFTVMNVSANISFSPESIDIAQNRSFNLTILNNAAEYAARISSFNLSFNSSDFQITALSNLTAGWTCSAASHYLNCTGTLNSSGSAIINVTLLAKNSNFGNRTANLTVFNSTYSGSASYDILAPQILPVARLAANATSVTLSKTRLVNFTFNNSGLLTITNFTGTFPSQISLINNVTGNSSNLQCGNTSFSTFKCNGSLASGALGWVVMNVTAWASAVGQFNVTMTAYNATATIPLDNFAMNITKAPVLTVYSNTSSTNVSLGSSVYLSGYVFNCYDDTYCASAVVTADWRIHTSSSGYCNNLPSNSSYTFTVGPNNGDHAIYMHYGPQSVVMPSVVSSCKYWLGIIGYSLDTNESVTSVTNIVGANITTYNASTPGSSSPGGAPPSLPTISLAMTLSPTSFSLLPGGKKNVTITVRLSGTASLPNAVTLACTAPSGFTVTSTPSSSSPVVNTTNNVFNLSIVASASVPVGSYVLPITATSGSYSARANLTMVILAQAGTTTTIPANGTADNSTNGTAGNLNATVTGNSTKLLVDLETALLKLGTDISKLNMSGSNVTGVSGLLTRAKEYLRLAAEAYASGNTTGYEFYAGEARKLADEAGYKMLGMKLLAALPSGQTTLIAAAVLLVLAGGGYLVYRGRKAFVTAPKRTVKTTKHEMNAVLSQFSDEIREPLDGSKGGK